MDRRWALLILCVLLCCAYAQNETNSSIPASSNDTDESYPYDPILKYRPSFARSLPIQILLTGIVLALTSVLLIHLVFTAQYHWPLAPVNYALQLSAVSTLLTSLIATMHVVLQATTKESREWPYMLNYLSVDIPPLSGEPPLSINSGWTFGELAAWLLMNATTSALVQITHIQFLTLLFPSSLERKLIYILLGPLAIVAAIMQLVPLGDFSITDDKLSNISDAVQNVCNATLSLLFTGSLFIWGLLVNRKQAWRTDGGTAAFGAGALLLAVASTTINFVYIPSKDQYQWMPGLMWSVVLWQSFLAWWWWVGAGMGVGEVDELLRKEEKRRRKRKARLEKSHVRRERAQTFLRGVAGAFGYSRGAEGQRFGPATEEHPAPFSSGSASERQNSRDGSRGRRSQSRRTNRPSQTSPQSSSASSTTATASGFFGRMKNHAAARYVYGWYLLLRHAHLTAAREQAVEQGERIQQVYGQDGSTTGAAEVDPNAVGWGLGSYGLRQIEIGERERDVEAEKGIIEAERASEDSSEDLEKVEHDEGAKSGVVDGPARARRRRNKHARTDTDGVAVDKKVVEVRAPDAEPPSMWYWGPLRRWRLQDSTVYN